MKFKNPFAKPSRQMSEEPTFEASLEGVTGALWLENNIIERLETSGDGPEPLSEVVSALVATALNKIDSENPGIRQRVADHLLELNQATHEGHRLTIRGKVFTVLPEYPTK